jgi:hypothetical protein
MGLICTARRMGSFGPRIAGIPAALSGGNFSTLARHRHTTISFFLSDFHRQHGVLLKNFLWWKSLRVTEAPHPGACHYSALLGLPLQPRASIYVFAEISPWAPNPSVPSHLRGSLPLPLTQTATYVFPSHRWSALGQVECLGKL